MTAVPAVKGKMGNIEYFKCTMSSKDLVACMMEVTLGNFPSANKYFLIPSSFDLDDFG